MQKNEAKQRAAAASNAIRSARSMAKFKACLEAAGAQLLEDEWLGARTKHRVLCAEGHECTPLPNNVISGFGFCKVCAKVSPKESFAKFKAGLEAAGARLLKDEWLGYHTPHKVVCAEGHECTPRPGNVIQGSGPCIQCGSARTYDGVWDIFYIVSGPAGIKLGVTRGDPCVRLGAHRRDGYTNVVRLWTGLPEGLAKATEDTLLARLKADSWVPVRGREYFPSGVLATVQRIAEAVLDGPGKLDPAPDPPRGT